MRNDKEKAFGLRKIGKSYNQIRDELSVPKSTLSGWFGPEGWSLNIKKSLNDHNALKSSVRIRALNKIRGENLKRAYAEALLEAKEEYVRLRHHPLFIAGLMLYWGEGDKVTEYQLRISNSDPGVLGVFFHFLRDICQAPEDRLRACVFIYKDLDDAACRKYWSDHIGLDQKRFFNSVLLPSRHKTRKLGHGVCSLGISSKYLKQKLLYWIEQLSFDIVSEGYYKYAAIV